MGWTNKIVDLAAGGLPSAAMALVPEHLKRRWQERLGDHNPFKTISANHDLVRATRLAWIEAAQAVLKEAREYAPAGEFRATEDRSETFDRLVSECLLDIRDHALDRRKDPGVSPIDGHVEAIINGVPELVALGDHVGIGGPVTSHFGAVLSALSGWDQREIPRVVLQVAELGLLPPGGGRARPFGELVFAAFAEIVKDPKKYPQAREAFYIAMDKLGRDIGHATLVAVQGLDGKLDAVLGGLEVIRIPWDDAAREDIAATRRMVEEIRNDYRHEIDLLKTSLHATESDLIALLANILGRRVARESLVSAVEQSYERLTELRASAGDLRSLANEVPEITHLLERADAALQSGEHFSLDAADQALAEADLRYQAIIRDREETLKRDKENRARLLGRRAAMARVRFDYRRASALYREQSALLAEALGPDHPDTATSYDNVAVNLNAQGRYSEAEPLFRKALEIRERVLGPDHPDTAASYNNVAFNLTAQGRAGEAEPLYRKALEIFERVVGLDHPSIAMSYDNLAVNLTAQGRHDEAESFRRTALEIRERLRRRFAPRSVPLTRASVLDVWCRRRGRSGPATPPRCRPPRGRRADGAGIGGGAPRGGSKRAPGRVG
jgi:tetratricopeptide (TPR) repeat protein